LYHEEVTRVGNGSSAQLRAAICRGKGARRRTRRKDRPTITPSVGEAQGTAGGTSEFVIKLDELRNGRRAGFGSKCLGFMEFGSKCLGFMEFGSKCLGFMEFGSKCLLGTNGPTASEFPWSSSVGFFDPWTLTRGSKDFLEDRTVYENYLWIWNLDKPSLWYYGVTIVC